MDLAPNIARAASDALLPAVILAAVLAIAVLTALYGSDELSKRAREVLRILRRHDDDC